MKLLPFKIHPLYVHKQFVIAEPCVCNVLEIVTAVINQRT